jgi:hypothetical protein
MSADPRIVSAGTDPSFSLNEINKTKILYNIIINISDKIELLYNIEFLVY